MYLSVMDYLRRSYQEAFGHSIKDAVNEALNPEKVDFFGINVDPSVYTAILILLVGLIFCLVIRIFVIPRFKRIPGKFQLLLESLVGFFDNSSKKATHKNSSLLGSFAFTTAIYIAIGTLIELLGIRPVFASINACVAMGLSAFLIINYVSFKELKLKRFKRYFPNILNVVSDISAPISMSLRIFGSVISGFIIAEVLYTSIYTSILIPAFAAIVTTIVHAFLQAYIYTTLTNLFVMESLE